MSVAWMVMKIISWRLWLPYRIFPQVPVIAFTGSLQVVLFVLFFIITIGLLVKPLHAFLLSGCLFIEIITLLGDEVRWMPWEYQFLFIILAVLINKKNPQSAISAIILIIASSYVFSGLQKINGNFLYNVWHRLILTRFFRLPVWLSGSPSLYWSGLIIPIFEIASGILILLTKQRKVYAVFPLFIHLFIILFLSPAGIAYNESVIPWNVAMGAFIYILFIKNRFVFSAKRAFYRGNTFIAIAWIALPVAGCFGYWDKFFSSGVYSGNVSFMRIYMADEAPVPPELKPYIVHSKTGYQGLHQVIDLHEWGMTELRVAIPPETRIYKQIEQSFSHTYADLKPVYLISEK